MKADEFLARLRQVREGKELVDLLIQAGAVSPPMKCPFPPEKRTKVAPMNNTPFVPAGTHGKVLDWCDKRDNEVYDAKDVHHYTVRWEYGDNGIREQIDQKRHELYSLYYVY